MPTYKYHLYRLKEDWCEVEAKLNRLRGLNQDGAFSRRDKLLQKLQSLWKEYPQMEELFRIHITELKGKAVFEYETIKSKMKDRRLKFAKTILFSNNPRFTERDIVEAYFGKNAIEEQFRQMKNPHHIALRPIWHWTDSMIRLHIFTCVIALMLRKPASYKSEKGKH